MKWSFVSSNPVWNLSGAGSGAVASDSDTDGSNGIAAESDTRPFRLIARRPQEAGLPAGGGFWKGSRETFILGRARSRTFRSPVLGPPGGFLAFFQSRF